MCNRADHATIDNKDSIDYISKFTEIRHLEIIKDKRTLQPELKERLSSEDIEELLKISKLPD